MRTSITMITALTVCLLAVAASPAAAEVEVPEEWLGVWSLETSVYDCETDVLIFSSADLDTLCPGSMFEDPDGGDITVDCTGSADAGSFTMHCEGSTEAAPGCTANFVYDATGTRNGDSYTSTATINMTFTGDCPLIPDSCQRIETTATRIDDSAGPCTSTPVESWSWGTVKSLYQ